MKNIFSFIMFCLTLFTGCGSKERVLGVVLAGHAYGHPLEKSLGLHSGLKEFLKKEPNDLVFFLGDFVRNPSLKSFEFLKMELKGLKIETKFVPGNHDVVNPVFYQKYIGNRFYSYEIKGVKFVVLDGNMNGWNIINEQLSFLKQELSHFEGKVFVLVHQIIWIDGEDYEYVQSNSTSGKAKELNFWKDVFPLLDKHNNEVFVCAGDLGAFKTITNPIYDKKSNVHLIGTGMGARYRDNCIQVNVYSGGEIELEVVSLQPGLSFGDLEDYSPSN